MKLGVVKWILWVEKVVVCSGVVQVCIKILVSLVIQFNLGLKVEVLFFILEDVWVCLDLVFVWFYQEYNVYLVVGVLGFLDKYEDCFICLLFGLQEKLDQKDGIFIKVVLEVLFIIESVLEVVCKYCEDESCIYLGMFIF